MSLTEQVAKAQVKNILAKLKAGKTITRAEQAVVAKFEAGQAPDLVLEEVAAHFGISRVAAMKWKRKMAQAGLPWNSLEEIQKWRDAEENVVTPKALNAVKKTKLEREIRRLEIKIETEEGRLIERAEVRDAGIRLASAWCAELDAMVQDLPGQVAGMSEAELQPRLRARVELLKTKVRAECGAL